jgi:UDP-glucose 4-epimerase
MPLAGKRVIVTGGLGFIGSNVARRCLELGARVTVYDCLDPKSGGNMHNVKDIESDLELVLNDIRNFEGVSAAIRQKEILISCAAYTSHPNSMKEPLIDVEVNCKGVINLLEAARRFNSEIKLVHIGTSTQIGRMVRNPVDETHPEFPLDIYSANKTVSEKYVLIYGSAYKLRTCIVRLANVFGPRSNIRTPDFGFMNYFIGLGLQGKEIPVFGEGKQMRNISYVEDCVEAILNASQSPKSDGEVLFAVADRQYTVSEIANEIAEHIGGKVKQVPWPAERSAIEIGDALISNAKIKAILGWMPSHDLPGGLGKTKRYFSKCLQKYL